MLKSRKFTRKIQKGGHWEQIWHVLKCKLNVIRNYGMLSLVIGNKENETFCLASYAYCVLSAFALHKLTDCVIINHKISIIWLIFKPIWYCVIWLFSNSVSFSHISLLKTCIAWTHFSFIYIEGPVVSYFICFRIIELWDNTYSLLYDANLATRALYLHL
jgi:hypothetical protein